MQYARKAQRIPTVFQKGFAGLSPEDAPGNNQIRFQSYSKSKESLKNPEGCNAVFHRISTAFPHGFPQLEN